LFEFDRLLPLARGLQHFVFSLRAKVDHARFSGRFGTVSTTATSQTIRPVKGDLNDGIAPAILTGIPAFAGVPLGASHRLAIPVNLKTSDGETLSGLGLPTGVGGNRIHQVKPIVSLTGQHLPGSDISGIDQMFGRQQSLLGQSGVDAGGDMDIGGGGRGGFHVGDQVGGVRVTGFGDMSGVAGAVQLV
jgi:hypothetical protein